MLAAIKTDVERAKRMASNTRNKFLTPQVSKFVSRTRNPDMNYSVCSNLSLCSNRSDCLLLPALEPDYGITRDDKPKYFQNPYQAITCLYSTYDL